MGMSIKERRRNRVAVIENSTNNVINVIISAVVPTNTDEFNFVAVPEWQSVDKNYKWSANNGLERNMTRQEQNDMRAKILAIEIEGLDL